MDIPERERLAIDEQKRQAEAGYRLLLDAIARDPDNAALYRERLAGLIDRCKALGIVLLGEAFASV
jgi:hypothetical protein